MRSSCAIRDTFPVSPRRSRRRRSVRWRRRHGPCTGTTSPMGPSARRPSRPRTRSSTSVGWQRSGPACAVHFVATLRNDKTSGMSILNEPIHTLRGEDTSLAAFDGKAILAVNVASKCGLTPQYTGLEALQEKYADKGFTVVGFPCNQFGGQEPGTAEDIETFCSTTYGVTFPMMEKIDVNGEDRHPIYAELTEVADAEGHSGDIRWNFEKFLIAPDGIVSRFSPMVTPEDPALVEAIEASLPG